VGASDIYPGPVKIEWGATADGLTSVGTTDGGFTIRIDAPQEAVVGDQHVGVIKKTRPVVRSYVSFAIQEYASVRLLENLMGLEQSPEQGVKISPDVGTLYLKLTRINHTGAGKIYTTQVWEPEIGDMVTNKAVNPLEFTFEEVPTGDVTDGTGTFGTWSAS